MLRSLFRRLFKYLLWFMAASVVLVAVLRWVPPPGTMVMVERKVGSWVDGQPIDLQRDWRSWEQLPDSLKVAVIAGEDQHFAEHHGFDLPAIQQALAHNERGGSIRGASTLSQQVAKNVFLVRAQLAAQGPGGLVHPADRDALDQATDSRGLPEQRRMGPGRLRRAGCGTLSLRPRRRAPEPHPGQPARRGAAQPAEMERGQAGPLRTPARGLDSPADVAVGRRRLPAAPGALKAQRGGFSRAWRGTASISRKSSSGRCAVKPSCG